MDYEDITDTLIRKTMGEFKLEKIYQETEWVDDFMKRKKATSGWPSLRGC